MKSINEILAGSLSLESEPTLIPAMESLIDMAVLADSRITLEALVTKFTLADGNVVDMMIVENDYKQWLADNDLETAASRATGPTVVEDAQRTLAALQQPSLESDLLQAMKRTFGAVSLNLKTFGKNLFEIKQKIKAKGEYITRDPILLDSVDTYRFLTKANKPVAAFTSCIDDDVKFVEACEKHYQALFEKAKDLSKRFREATTSKSVEAIREAIDYFDEGILSRSDFEELTKFNLLGNRSVQIDKRGYPKITRNAGGVESFTTKAGDENNLVTGIANGHLHGWAVGGVPHTAPGIAGFNMTEGQKKFDEGLKKSKGVVELNDFVKVLDRAQVLNQQSVRFAQMAASMGERVLRMSDDLDDAYTKTVDEETGKFDHVVYRELLDLRKSARRSVSQYMFLAKLLATMMEDHATFVYRGVTTMANQVLSKAKPPKADKASA
jgi:hypothetical protein